MSQNQKALTRAKTAGEPLFYSCFTSNIYGDTCKYALPRLGEVEFKNFARSGCESCAKCPFDCKHHTDMLADGHYMLDGHKVHSKFLFDVKDVEDENLSTGNYTIPADEAEDFCESIDNHYLAFWLNDGKVRLNEFIVVNANELCNMMHEHDANAKCKCDKFCHGAYYLVPKSAIYSCHDKFAVKGDF